MRTSSSCSRCAWTPSFCAPASPAPSPQARQVVVHRHILVDGKIVDRPSFRVKPGQTIQVKPQLADHGALPGRRCQGAHRDVLPARSRSTSTSSSRSFGDTWCAAPSAPRSP